MYNLSICIIRVSITLVERLPRQDSCKLSLVVKPFAEGWLLALLAFQEVVGQDDKHGVSVKIVQTKS